MTLENSKRYIKVFYPMIIVAAGMMALSWTSSTPALSSRQLLHPSFKSEGLQTILSPGSSCKADHLTPITSTQAKCRLDDGDSSNLISRRDPLEKPRMGRRP